MSHFHRLIDSHSQIIVHDLKRLDLKVHTPHLDLYRCNQAVEQENGRTRALHRVTAELRALSNVFRDHGDISGFYV
jgi:hypothetical protein